MGRTICAVLACFLLAIVGCEKETASTPSTQPARAALTGVKLQLNWKPEPQFGGFYAAQVNGAYAKHKLDAEITPGGAGAPTVEMIGAGTVPFAVVSGDEIIRARATGNRIVALFAVYQINPQGIMTRASRGFKAIDDIFSHEGTLAMERGLPYSDFLQKKYGFDKLKIVPSPFGDLSLYRTDANYAMQCFVTSEPLAAKKTGIEPQTFLVAEAGYNPYTTVLATSESYLKSNPTIVKAMVAAVREGWQSYLSDPTATNEMMGKLNPTMDAQTFADSAHAQMSLIQTDEAKRLGLGAMTAERWQVLVKQLTELNAVQGPVNADECWVDVSKLQ